MNMYCKECRRVEQFSNTFGCVGCDARLRRRRDSSYTPPPYDSGGFANVVDNALDRGAAIAGSTPDAPADSLTDWSPSGDTFSGGGGDFGGGGASGDW